MFKYLVNTYLSQRDNTVQLTVQDHKRFPNSQDNAGNDVFKFVLLSNRLMLDSKQLLFVMCLLLDVR